MHTVKPPALPPHFFRGDLPQALNFREFFFWEFPLNNEKSVDMPKQGVVIMNGCDKRDAVAELRFEIGKIQATRRFPASVTVWDKETGVYWVDAEGRGFTSEPASSLAQLFQLSGKPCSDQLATSRGLQAVFSIRG